jgi:hypothetical protein
MLGFVQPSEVKIKSEKQELKKPRNFIAYKKKLLFAICMSFAWAYMRHREMQ